VQDTARQHGGQYVRVLGYAEADASTLRHEAMLSPNPTIGNLYDADRLDSHEMPESFREGRTLQFEVRACPVVRKSSAGTGRNQSGDKRTWDEGEELDAFLAEAWTRPDDEDLSREGVYREWLKRQFDVRGGATVQEGTVAMERFSLERMTRRNGPGHTPDTLKRPDVTLTGRLTVTNSDAFIRLLRSGLGRHKSFGYGMLKVRRG
jgi:CRISPR system Cascade subunit CasE